LAYTACEARKQHRVLKNIPDNEKSDWLADQKYPADYFHVQLIKA
jgi:hypothetical protein